MVKVNNLFPLLDKKSFFYHSIIDIAYLCVKTWQILLYPSFTAPLRWFLENIGYAKI